MTRRIFFRGQASCVRNSNIATPLFSTSGAIIPDEIAHLVTMKRGAPAPPAKRYKAAQVHSEVRDFMGKVGLQLQDRGWSVTETVSLFADAGSFVSEDTLRRYYRKIRGGSTPLSAEKATGRRSRLMWEERAVVVGFFLVREDAGLQSTLQTYIDAADRFFSVKLGTSIAQRYLEEFHLSSKFMGLRSGKDSRTKNDLIAEALADLQRFHDSGFLSVKASHLWCIDAVTDTRRNERVTSYGRKGGTQRKFVGSSPKYTSTIITMVNAEGKQVGPAIFTHNPDLDPDGWNGEAVQAKCKFLDLDIDNIYFVKSNKLYHKEDTNCYYSFLSEYGTWEGHRILSDRGQSFKVGDEDLFDSLGFDWHETFTPSVHGPLSINDGHLHSVAKAAWRQERDDKDPEWVHTLLLAHEVFHVPPAQTAAKWKQHMLYKRRPLAKGVEELFFQNETKENAHTKLWDQCIGHYREFAHENELDELF